MIIWALIGLLVVVLNFLPNYVVNTNCSYMYSSSILVVIGTLVGMSGRPIIASSIIVFGGLLVINKLILLEKDRQCKNN